MALGSEAADAATPHRLNVGLQALIDRSPSTTFESPTPSQPSKRKRNMQTQPVAWPRLQTPGRSQAAPTNHPTGMQTSMHATDTATAALGSIFAEHQRLQNIKQQVLTLIARSLDNVVSSCAGEQKVVAKEITTHFSNFLSEKIFSTEATTPQGTWAAAASSSQPGNTSSTKGNQQPPPPPAKPEDIRILARLPDEARDWGKKQSTFALRTATCKEVGLELADITAIHHTATGFAIKPRTKEIRQKILAKAKELSVCLRATKFDLAVTWSNYVVPHCPTQLRGITGELIDTETVINEEVFAQTKTRPTSVRPSRHPVDPRTNTRSWIVSFLEPVAPFSLFGESGYSRLITKKPTLIRHNPGCQGYHTQRFCARTPRCENCGNDSTNQHPNPCTHPPKCANCHGPAPADHDNCPAKPTRKAGKLVPITKRELAKIRRVGEKLYDNMHRPYSEERNQDPNQQHYGRNTAEPNDRCTQNSSSTTEESGSELSDIEMESGAEPLITVTTAPVIPTSFSTPRSSSRPTRKSTQNAKYTNPYEHLNLEQ
ncbi:hypothetical protein ACJ41O_013889 [Fusarium nematophilum]